MALRDWMIAFNNAKEMEANGEQGSALIAEYERVIDKLGEGPFTEAQNHIRKEVFRNLYELYSLADDTEKAAFYEGLKKNVEDIEIEDEM